MAEIIEGGTPSVKVAVDPVATDSTFDEAAKLWPVVSKYKKLLVSLVGTTGPFVVYLLAGSHTAAEYVSSATAYVLLNFGVYEAKNG